MRQLVGGAVRRWARSAHQHSLANARLGATECSRRRLERVEVETYLERLHRPDHQVVASIGAPAAAASSATAPVALAVH